MIAMRRAPGDRQAEAAARRLGSQGRAALLAPLGGAAPAAAARVSPSQVTRFCRALDFDGLVDFRRRLAASLAPDEHAWRGLSANARARSAGPA